MTQKSIRKANANSKLGTVQNTIAGSGPFSPLVPRKTYVSYTYFGPLSCNFTGALLSPDLPSVGTSLDDRPNDAREC